MLFHRLHLRRILLRLTAALTLILSLPAQINRVEDLKAALILSFARFTDWPAAPVDSPLIIGVAGDNELLQSLLRLTNGKNIQGRPILVRPIRNLSDVRSCHFLHLGSLDNKKFDEYLSAARSASLLTMAESSRFLDSGGIIHLFEQDGRLNFAVHLGNLNRARLSISSKLLRLGYTQRDNSSARERP